MNLRAVSKCMDNAEFLTYFLIALFSIVSVFLLVVMLNRHYQHPCIKSHIQAVHEYARTEMMFTGKTVLPIYHPERDYTITVCDERK